MPNSNFYRNSGVSEISMRDELTRFLDGSLNEISKKQAGVLRKMRRTTTGALIECECVDDTTKEPDKSNWCPFCASEGFIWDEIYVEFYKQLLRSDQGNALVPLMPASIINVPIYVFYLKSSVEITEDDKIVELVLDSEGDPVKPYRRKNVCRIGKAQELRSDRGRLEFWQVYAVADTNRFLNGPESE